MTLARLNREMSGHRGQPQFPSFVTSVTSVRCSLHFASFSHGTHRGLLSVIENCIAGE
jgi:hypothetical protein